ncbi:aminotransferase class I/II-fold pyridoxal phosphate-dependent enzyme [Planotetraspora sp. A-T 1434]|uniref:aminotransferase class I/II-fold pyridoxal phosphate-dependent enzyme n=1 Tax=Planotetraspora sp. A-T 1434 TaxID=2979219 RepID=UPI0021C088A4|nr:aminotransferase class I/II-fold pyridoxal phosphate-dependent enzyme [Planotetraspora sp. A-T 1434]MCT9934938.1 aminotransferase class I/II-fold pyridoxal phosphate-dependent enzyme [Planotetraspora sp. A-T 1434]
MALDFYQYSRLTAEAQARLAEEVIASGRLGSIGGFYVPLLETAVAMRTGRAHAVAMASATAALEVTLRALGVGAGSEVVVPAFGWVSVGAAVTATGAAVHVAAVGQSLTPSWEQVADALSPATAAVVIAHLRGTPAAHIARITAELRERGVPLIEDCAQAWGVPAAGSHGTAAFFSTQAYKLIATGEGGIVVCDDLILMAGIRALSGDTRVRTPEPVWRGNTRMPEIIAALAIPQLERLDALLEGLRALQRPAAELLGKMGAVLPIEGGNGCHVGVWCDTPQSAATLSARLNALGLRNWHPTVGDLHICDAWPVQTSSPDWGRYLDIQIPYLKGDARQAFLDLLQQAITFAESPA